jgi:hypothetical protein
MIQRVAEAFLFFHPVTWLLSEDLHQDREECCDAWVLTYRPDRELYASTLYSLVAEAKGLSLSISSMADRALLPRVRRILREDSMMLSGTQRLINVGVAFVFASFLVLTVHAQVAPKKKTDEKDKKSEEKELAIEIIEANGHELITVLPTFEGLGNNRVLVLEDVTEEFEIEMAEEPGGFEFELEDITEAFDIQEEPEERAKEIRELGKALRRALERIERLEQKLGDAASGPRPPRVSSPRVPNRPTAPRATDPRRLDLTRPKADNPLSPRRGMAPGPVAPSPRVGGGFSVAGPAVQDPGAQEELRALIARKHAEMARARAELDRAEMELDRYKARPGKDVDKSWFDRSTRQLTHTEEVMKARLMEAEALEVQAKKLKLEADRARADIEALRKQKPPSPHAVSAGDHDHGSRVGATTAAGARWAHGAPSPSLFNRSIRWWMPVRTHSRPTPSVTLASRWPGPSATAATMAG